MTFQRYLKKRKRRWTAGKTAIYLLVPCGPHLPSTQELQHYCNKHKIIYDDTVANFSSENIYQGRIKLDKESESESQIEEALLTKEVIPLSLLQAKVLPDSQKWKEATEKEIQIMLDKNSWTPAPRTDQKVIGTK